MPDHHVVPALLKNLSAELARLTASRHFSPTWLTDCSNNVAGWLHARVWAALVRAVPPGYVPNLEVRLTTPGRVQTSFKPDLLICDHQDRPLLAVELESTNSSDDRVILRDIDRLQYLARAPEACRPEIVLLLTMLPSCPVPRIPMYRGLSPSDKKGRAQRRMNPYAFHKEPFLRALASSLPVAAPLSIAWANIDTDAIRLEYWNGPYEKRRSWPISAVNGA